MNMHRLERKILNGTRYASLAAIAGSAAGAFLMFAVGLASMWKAVSSWLVWPLGKDAAVAAVINVIEGLDRFLIALVLLYFAYGVHSLFIRSDASLEEEEFNLPKSLQVKQVGQLKQVVAEVIIVILFVLFLRHALEVFQQANPPLSWEALATLLVLPVCAALLGAALKLAELHPKPARPSAILTPPTHPRASTDSK